MRTELASIVLFYPQKSLLHGLRSYQYLCVVNRVSAILLMINQREGKMTMSKTFFLIALTTSILLATSEQSKDQKERKLDEQIHKQMEKEKKYAKEQTFYHGDEYDLKSYEVDPDSLPDVPSIEPDYDFDMSEGIF